MPSRIIDSLVNGAKISVTRCSVLDAGKLRFLVDAAYKDRRKCEYDLSAAISNFRFRDFLRRRLLGRRRVDLLDLPTQVVVPVGHERQRC